MLAAFCAATMGDFRLRLSFRPERSGVDGLVFRTRLAQGVPDSRQCLEQRRNRRVIPEGAAGVNIAIDIPGTNHEASSKLKRIFSQPVLAMSAGPRPFARRRVFLPEKMKQRCSA